MFEDLFGELESSLTGIVESEVFQVLIYVVIAYIVLIWLASAYWAYRDMRLRSASAITPYVAASRSSSSRRSSSCSGSWSTASCDPRRPSPRSTNAPSPRRRCWPRWPRTRSAPTAHARSTRTGSSAPPAATGCVASAPTASTSSSSTGRCVPGAARTSSAPRRPARPPFMPSARPAPRPAAAPARRSRASPAPPPAPSRAPGSNRPRDTRAAQRRRPATGHPGAGTTQPEPPGTTAPPSPQPQERYVSRQAAQPTTGDPARPRPPSRP